MGRRILAMIMPVLWAALLGACSTNGTTDETVGPETTSPPVATMSPQTTLAPSTGLDTWTQEVNGICAQAIDSYQEKKALTGDPELLAVAAAAAVKGAAQDLSVLSSPTGDAEGFVALADEYASQYQAYADAMEEGRIQDSIAASDALDSAGTSFASKAQDVGADSCAEMVEKV